ncbi:40S ribosomal protein S11 isoform X2 [Helianthus annuus]|uniref:40S ribosomal protein S11 isoform X2 n=1 Tax=Helianthus annuus TaxID=4232 RepID=UPI000B8FE0D7|nr:40S ribosomal protein S11 isoform X2 [Helianthus annuus]
MEAVEEPAAATLLSGNMFTFSSSATSQMDCIDGTYIDKKCPFTGDVSIRGRILAGTCHSAERVRTIIVHRDYLYYVKKYQRYEKRHSNIPAHISPCFRVKEGDHVTVGQCRFALPVHLFSYSLYVLLVLTWGCLLRN